MQADESRQKLMWMGLIVLAFIAGAVVSMAGFHSVKVSPQAPAAHGNGGADKAH